jgi:hypothetical protein
MPRDPRDRASGGERAPGNPGGEPTCLAKPFVLSLGVDLSQQTLNEVESREEERHHPRGVKLVAEESSPSRTKPPNSSSGGGPGPARVHCNVTKEGLK